MRFLDLFAGLGGFRLGMQQAGHECVGWIEWDKFARKSYEAIHNAEGEWTWNDISTVDYRQLPRADAWCFGFPCQDISVANENGKGFKGNRSSLYFAVTKRLRQIKEWDPERMPSYLLIENVKNFLSVNGGWDFLFAQIELDEIGYDCEWELLNTTDFGLPQNRERVFLVGHLRGRDTRKVFPITGTLPSDIGNNNQKQDRITKPVLTPNRLKKRQNGRRMKEDGEPMFTLTAQDKHGIYDGEKMRILTPRETWRLQGFPDWAFDKAAEVNSDHQLYRQSGNAVSVPVIYEIAKRL